MSEHRGSGRGRPKRERRPTRRDLEEFAARQPRKPRRPRRDEREDETADRPRPARPGARGGTVPGAASKATSKATPKTASKATSRTSGTMPKSAPRAAAKAPGRSAPTPPASSRVVRESEPMRIQRALARAGVLSRRKADELVASGRVTVNGATASIGQVVDPARDRILVDGQPIEAPVTDTWMVLNKPAGYLTSRGDPEGRPTVFQLVPDTPGLTYVGRLDFMTEGLLLLTTDGAAAHRLTHPSAEIERTYEATVRGNAMAAVRAARAGVELEDGLVVPTHVEAAPMGSRRWLFALTITEGRNREVRRLCEALGLEVERLVRTRFGPVTLGELPPGRTRALTSRELGVIRALAGRG